jgi:hypothetical protein
MKLRYNIFSLLFLSIGIIMASGFYTSIKAEAVFMNDGSIIEGKVIRDTDKIISIKPQAGPVRDIQRKDLIRVLYSDDYKNKVYIYKLDDTMVEGYIVYEDRINYTIRENLVSANELSLSKDKVNYISKKKTTPAVIEKKVEVVKVVEVEKVNETPAEKPAEEKYRIFGMDWGIGINLPFYDEKDFYYSSMNWFMTIAGIRFNLFFDFRFNIASLFSMGAETGINFFPNLLKTFISLSSYSNLLSGSGYLSSSDFFLDVPVRGFIRFGAKKLYGQIFGGYYIGIFPLASFMGQNYFERGGELGGRVCLGGFYMEVSYIFVNKEAYNLGHFRAAMGYTGRIF